MQMRQWLYGGLIGAVIAGAGNVMVQGAGSDIITACVDNATRVLTVPPAGTPCGPDQSSLSWNRQNPADAAQSQSASAPSDYVIDLQDPSQPAPTPEPPGNFGQGPAGNLRVITVGPVPPSGSPAPTTATAPCPQGPSAVSGGFKIGRLPTFLPGNTVDMYESRPVLGANSQPVGWTASMYDPSGFKFTLTVYAICAPTVQ
jgi:hypothetical protein